MDPGAGRGGGDRGERVRAVLARRTLTVTTRGVPLPHLARRVELERGTYTLHVTTGSGSGSESGYAARSVTSTPKSIAACHVEGSECVRSGSMGRQGNPAWRLGANGDPADVQTRRY